MKKNQNYKIAFNQLEKYINEQKCYIYDKNPTCGCENMNYVNLSSSLDNSSVTIISKKNKKHHKNIKKKFIKNKYIKIIISCIVLFLLIIFFTKKQNIINQLKLILIKYQLFIKLTNIRKYFIRG